MEYVGCQEILNNKKQCDVPPIVTIDSVPYCRKHLAFKLNDPEIRKKNIKAIAPQNQMDIDFLIKFHS